MIELILDKKSIQIDEEFLDIKKHLEKFYSNKEQETIAQTLENGIFKLNLIYKIITLLLYQKSTKLILKNALFSIKAHILFSIFPLSFLSFLKTLITT